MEIDADQKKPTDLSSSQKQALAARCLQCFADNVPAHITVHFCTLKELQKVLVLKIAWAWRLVSRGKSGSGDRPRQGCCLSRCTRWLIPS
jgi:hypothetical protein